MCIRDRAISVRGLGKTYRIAHASDRPTRATEAIVARLRHPLRRTTFDRFEALTEVSFDVAAGTALGIIGRNGAGKSTLLKILTRITPPTRGQAELAGRVGSLLEVGTGFHPESVSYTHLDVYKRQIHPPPAARTSSSHVPRCRAG